MLCSIWGSGGMAPCSLNRGCAWRWVVSFTPGCLTLWEIAVSIRCLKFWVGLRASQGEEETAAVYCFIINPFMLKVNHSQHAVRI